MSATRKSDTIPLTALLLTLAGVLPFVFCALALWFNLPILEWLVWSQIKSAWHILLVTYSCVILAFLSGIHWGIAMQLDETKLPKGAVRNLLIWSNVMALVAWLCLLLYHYIMMLVLLIGSFTLQWILDVVLSRYGLAPPWFGRLRTIVTPIVLVALAIAFFAEYRHYSFNLM